MRPAARAVGGLVLAVLLSSCTASPAPPSAPEATPPGAAAAPEPAWESNFPDPMVVPTDSGFLAVATNGNGSNVQTLTSPDLETWSQGPDALPELAGWTSPGKVWAPEVVEGPEGYLLYYTTKAPDPAIQCISVARSARAEGPYDDSSRRPLVCETKQGGSIDAHAFTASDGGRYLYWKNDGNAVGQDTYLSVQPLDATGTRLTGTPRRLFKQDLPWEGDLVEAPFLWEHEGRFHLFYSANAFYTADYAVGHAVADSPLGPFTKTTEPVLASTDVAAGPGHCSLFSSDGTVWMAYHAWDPEAVGSEIPGRVLWLAEVTFAPDGTVSVAPPEA